MKLTNKILNEDTILSKKKYEKKLNEFLLSNINKFLTAGVLSKEDIKECLKNIYKQFK